MAKNSLRNDKFYKKLTPYMATAIAEGFCEGEGATEHEQLCAWQYLVDTGLAWQLQGSFGRAAADMLESGVIQPVNDLLVKRLKERNKKS